MNIDRALGRMNVLLQRDPAPESIDLREDELFEILSASRRRAVIRRLADGDRDPPTCAELAVEIAADEAHMDPAVVPPRRVQPVEDDLRTEHLPRLADAGLLRWAGGAGAVRADPSVAAVARLLAEIGDRVKREPVLPFASWGAGRSADVHEPPSGSRYGPPM